MIYYITKNTNRNRGFYEISDRYNIDRYFTARMGIGAICYVRSTWREQIRFGRLLYIKEAHAASLHRWDSMNVTYILRCSDGTLYTGWTNDIEKRLRAHNEGQGAKYTRGRTPVELVYLEDFETKQEAMKREAAIKKLTKEDKLHLIAVCDVETMLQGLRQI